MDGGARNDLLLLMMLMSTNGLRRPNKLGLGLECGIARMEGRLNRLVHPTMSLGVPLKLPPSTWMSRALHPLPLGLFWHVYARLWHDSFLFPCPLSLFPRR